MIFVLKKSFMLFDRVIPCKWKKKWKYHLSSSVNASKFISNSLSYSQHIHSSNGVNVIISFFTLSACVFELSEIQRNTSKYPKKMCASLRTAIIPQKTQHHITCVYIYIIYMLRLCLSIISKFIWVDLLCVVDFRVME